MARAAKGLAVIAKGLRPLAVEIGDLTPDPRNARLHGDRNLAAIEASLRLYGQRKPLVVRREGMVVTAGNGTLEAARKLGWTHVAALVVDDDAAMATGYAVADNRTAELATWDEARLVELLQEVEDEYPSAELGFSEEEVSALLDSVQESSGVETAETEPTAPPKKPTSKAGRVYQLGPHRLLCGDSTDAEAVARLYGEEKARMVWTDPPYGVSYAAKNEMLNAYDKGSRNQTPIEGDDAEPEEVGELIRGVLAPIPRAQGAACYIAGANQVEIQTAMIEAATAAGYHIRWNLIWVKDNHVLGRADYLAKHETILYGWATDGPHLYSGHYRQSVFIVARPRASVDHPTMKPVALIEPMLMNSSNRDEIVADPFGGSGSTLLAAASAGRRCYTSEIYPAYCDVIRRRWGDYARANGIPPGPDAL